MMALPQYAVERRNALTFQWERERRTFRNSGAAQEHVRSKRAQKANSRAAYRVVTPSGVVSITYVPRQGGRS
jgi:hypothetical protein